MRLYPGFSTVHKSQGPSVGYRHLQCPGLKGRPLPFQLTNIGRRQSSMLLMLLRINVRVRRSLDCTTSQSHRHILRQTSMNLNKLQGAGYKIKCRGGINEEDVGFPIRDKQSHPGTTAELRCKLCSGRENDRTCLSNRKLDGQVLSDP